MKIIVYLCVCLTILLFCASVQGAGDCPLSNKVQNCTPKCLHDAECSAVGGKCCRNSCNGRSCAQPNVLVNSGSSSGAFGNKNSASTGTYCGNVKCSPYEKCDMDRSTKRPTCVRA